MQKGRLKWGTTTRTPASGQHGFTLIELLIVVAIIGVLSAIIIPKTSTFIGTATLNAANTELQQVKVASLAYYGNTGHWPADSAALSSLMSGTPKATYLFHADNGVITGFSTSTWSGISWEAPQGTPPSGDGIWTR